MCSYERRRLVSNHSRTADQVQLCLEEQMETGQCVVAEAQARLSNLVYSNDTRHSTHGTRSRAQYRILCRSGVSIVWIGRNQEVFAKTLRHPENGTIIIIAYCIIDIKFFATAKCHIDVYRFQESWILRVWHSH